MGAVLVVPDLADRLYIRDLVHILLVDMGFKQVAVHQVSPDILFLWFLSDL